MEVNRQKKALSSFIAIMPREDFIFTVKPSVNFIGECGLGFGPAIALCSKALNEIRLSDLLEGGDDLKTMIRCKPILDQFERYGKSYVLGVLSQ